MRILVTGVEGYIGSLLAPILLRQGHEVVGMDTGFFREGWLYSERQTFPSFPRLLNKDLRSLSAEDLQGFEAIIHLAELSNDPLGQHNPENTYQINHAGSVTLARVARRVGVSRFVYTSSCSVYGVGNGEFLSEDAAVDPQTAYARCKVLVERDVGALASNDFSPTFLRNATAYGASPRMRFDIVLNHLAGLAWTTKQIALVSDGKPWRPVVHVMDICQAILCTLNAPREAIHNETFNVGRTDQNFSIRKIAELVAEVFPGCELIVGPSGGDHRSYRVSFEKIREHLPEFRCEWTADAGAQELKELFERIDMRTDTFEFRAFTRLRQLEYLIRTRQIDNEFFWTH